jgi:hypothetical protein
VAVRETAPPVELLTRPAGIMIGTPMYGGQCFEDYLLGALSVQTECHKRGIPSAFHTIRNESLIPRGRNRVMRDFLASDASHLVFIDADIGFVGTDVLRLVAHCQANPGSIIGATYAKKSMHEYRPAFVPMPHGVVVTEAELIEVRCVPGGFMCIPRDVAMQMAGAHRGEYYLDGNTGTDRVIDLFATAIDPATKQYWSEDYAFCIRWRDMLGRVLLDPNILLRHNGTATFEGDPTSVFLNPPEQPRRKQARN